MINFDPVPLCDIPEEDEVPTQALQRVRRKANFGPRCSECGKLERQALGATRMCRYCFVTFCGLCKRENMFWSESGEAICRECRDHQTQQLERLKTGPCDVCSGKMTGLLRGKPRVCSICYLVCCGKCKREMLSENEAHELVCDECRDESLLVSQTLQFRSRPDPFVDMNEEEIAEYESKAKMIAESVARTLSQTSADRGKRYGDDDDDDDDDDDLLGDFAALQRMRPGHTTNGHGAVKKKETRKPTNGNEDDEDDEYQGNDDDDEDPNRDTSAAIGKRPQRRTRDNDEDNIDVERHEEGHGKDDEGEGEEEDDDDDGDETDENALDGSDQDELFAGLSTLASGRRLAPARITPTNTTTNTSSTQPPQKGRTTRTLTPPAATMKPLSSKSKPVSGGGGGGGMGSLSRALQTADDDAEEEDSEEEDSNSDAFAMDDGDYDDNDGAMSMPVRRKPPMVARLTDSEPEEEVHHGEEVYDDDDDDDDDDDEEEEEETETESDEEDAGFEDSFAVGLFAGKKTMPKPGAVKHKRAPPAATSTPPVSMLRVAPPDLAALSDFDEDVRLKRAGMATKSVQVASQKHQDVDKKEEEEESKEEEGARKEATHSQSEDDFHVDGMTSDDSLEFVEFGDTEAMMDTPRSSSKRVSREEHDELVARLERDLQRRMELGNDDDDEAEERKKSGVEEEEEEEEEQDSSALEIDDNDNDDDDDVIDAAATESTAPVTLLSVVSSFAPVGEKSPSAVSMVSLAELSDENQETDVTQPPSGRAASSPLAATITMEDYSDEVIVPVVAAAVPPARPAKRPAFDSFEAVEELVLVTDNDDDNTGEEEEEEEGRVEKDGKNNREGKANGIGGEATASLVPFEVVQEEEEILSSAKEVESVDANKMTAAAAEAEAARLAQQQREDEAEAARVVEERRQEEVAAAAEADRVAQEAAAAAAEAAAITAAEAEAARVEAARVEAARVEAARVEAVRQAAARMEAALAESERSAAESTARRTAMEAERSEAFRVEQERKRQALLESEAEVTKRQTAQKEAEQIAAEAAREVEMAAERLALAQAAAEERKRLAEREHLSAREVRSASSTPQNHSSRRRQQKQREKDDVMFMYGVLGNLRRDITVFGDPELHAQARAERRASRQRRRYAASAGGSPASIKSPLNTHATPPQPIAPEPTSYTSPRRRHHRRRSESTRAQPLEDELPPRRHTSPHKRASLDAPELTPSQLQPQSDLLPSRARSHNDLSVSPVGTSTSPSQQQQQQRQPRPPPYASAVAGSVSSLGDSLNDLNEPAVVVAAAHNIRRIEGPFEGDEGEEEDDEEEDDEGQGVPGESLEAVQVRQDESLRRMEALRRNFRMQCVRAAGSGLALDSTASVEGESFGIQAVAADAPDAELTAGVPTPDSTLAPAPVASPATDGTVERPRGDSVSSTGSGVPTPVRPARRPSSLIVQSSMYDHEHEPDRHTTTIGLTSMPLDGQLPSDEQSQSHLPMRRNLSLDDPTSVLSNVRTSSSRSAASRRRSLPPTLTDARPANFDVSTLPKPASAYSPRSLSRYLRFGYPHLRFSRELIATVGQSADPVASTEDNSVPASTASSSPPLAHRGLDQNIVRPPRRTDPTAPVGRVLPMTSAVASTIRSPPPRSRAAETSLGLEYELERDTTFSETPSTASMPTFDPSPSRRSLRGLFARRKKQ